MTPTMLETVDPPGRAAAKPHSAVGGQGFAPILETIGPDPAGVQAASAGVVATLAFAPAIVAGPAIGRVAATEAYQADRDPRR